MKNVFVLLAAVVGLSSSAVVFADHHEGKCHDSHGKAVTAKDEAACKKQHGTWGDHSDHKE